jgi:ribonuclease HI
MKHVIIYTDGACSGNPGVGGWGAVMTTNASNGDVVKEISGGAALTTNNRMELQAAISALNTLKEPCSVDLYTDSQYVQKGITEWINGWVRNGWKNSKKEPVKNADLWQELLIAAKPHQVTWRWVRGHAGDAGNERADTLARLATANYM